MAISTHPGGSADKGGNNYESLWAVRAMCELFDGNASSMHVETPGEDKAEFHLQKGDTLEYWQTKRQITGQDTWTIKTLSRAGILSYFYDKTQQGNLCVFASISEAPQLGQLIENAKASKDVASFKEHFTNKERLTSFNELKEAIGTDSDEDAYQFLLRMTLHGGREITLEPEFTNRLSVLFQGPGQTTMSLLRDLYMHSSHESLTIESVEQYLKERGIVRRRDGAPDIRERISAITQGYVSGQQSKFIGRTLIKRKLASEIVDELRDSTTAQNILISSESGGGKSACLYQIVEELRNSGMPVLAFRLDSVEPVKSTIALGEKIGLQESPVIALDQAWSGGMVTLVVDQVDCVSTYSGRHPEFFEILAAIKDEIAGILGRTSIHLILACREVDFESDFRLKQLLPAKQKPKKLGKFSESEVKEAITSAGGDSSLLTKQQLELLLLPQNLSLFIQAGLATKAYSFTTKNELFNEFWRLKRSAVSLDRPDFDTLWPQVLRHLVNIMSAGQKLTVPEVTMDNFPQALLSKMTSEGVLTFERRRYGFVHESFFDYCFARTQANGGLDFIQSLEAENQYLFRRAQLRQVLEFMRDGDFHQYLEQVRWLLENDSIRVFLKLHVVELICLHPEPKDEELAVLMPWIESELTHIQAGTTNPDKLALRIWESFFASRSLFPVADRMGLVERWLQSGKEWLEDRVTVYLRWKTEKHSERVAELLEPYVGVSDAWNRRLRAMMQWRNHEKSRRFFDLFLRLLDDGVLDEDLEQSDSYNRIWSHLHGFAEEKPVWCAEIAAHWLSRQVEIISNSSENEEIRWRKLRDQSGVDEIIKCAEKAPLEFLQFNLPIILQAAERASYAVEEGVYACDRIWHKRILSEHTDIEDAYLIGCEKAMEVLGEEEPEALRPFIEQVLPHRLYIANFLLISAYTAAPKLFADEALTQLANDSNRLICGYSDSAYWTTRKLIETCSPHCSKEVIEKLEETVMTYRCPGEEGKDGFKSRGHVAFTLLSAIPKEKLSINAVGRLGEWKEKYRAPKPSPRGIRGGFIGSPIEQNSAEKMTDEQWLRAIEKYNSAERIRSWDDPLRGGGAQLAQQLQGFVKNEPERFARLALQFPDDTATCYYMNVLYGLREADISSDLKLDVVRLVFGIEEEACLRPALDVLGSINDVMLPENAIAFIKRAVQNSDPEVEIWDQETPYYGGNMLDHGINTVRGDAAEAIRNLISENEIYIDVFREELERLASDSSLAVRSVAASTIHVIYIHNQEYALQLLDKLITADDRLLTSNYLVRFLRVLLRAQIAFMRPLIQRMLASTNEKTRDEGGVLACLARLYHESANDLAETALAGDEKTRLGAAEVAQANILHPECREWCEQTLPRLFNDESNEVRQKAAHCFWHLWQSPETPLTDFENLIGVFLKSPAFITDSSMLVHALTDSRQRLPTLTLDICEEFVNRCSDEARDIRTSRAADETYIGKLVFTAYEQLEGETSQIRALDLIDAMCLEGLHTAREQLSSLER